MIYVFDFDGVVCDSTDECMVCSWNAWQEWTGKNELRYKLKDFKPSDITWFKPLRPRVRGAGEYYILERARSEEINIDKQSDYDHLCEKWSDEISSFKKIFYQHRSELRQKDLKAWIDLHPIYVEVVSLIQNLQFSRKLFIATLKDRESVQLILRNVNIDIDDENLFDQSQINSKLDALNHIREKEKCEKEDIIFIDDNVTHLIGPKEAGYSVYLAAWGSITAEYLQIADDLKINILRSAASLILD